jgi:transposase InsO family protein
MDWQQLPAVKGGRGFRYKISVIHMSTRIKYSEIVKDYKSRTLAAFIKRAMDRLPPFYVVFTDNHMAFTMKYTEHPERQTEFTKTAAALQVAHALIEKGKPWRNGFIERSNRTDNEAIFKHIQFSSEEERCYYLRLWEMHYNRERTHQGIGMKTPYQVCQEQHFQRTSNMTLS